MAKGKGRPAGKSSTPANESKAEKFIRLASKRMTKTLNSIRQLGQLSGSGYESSPEQVAKMFGALNDAAKSAYDKFQSKGAKQTADSFKF